MFKLPPRTPLHELATVDKRGKCWPHPDKNLIQILSQLRHYLSITSSPASLSESASLDTHNIPVGFHTNQPAHVSPSVQLHQPTRHLNIISLRLLQVSKWGWEVTNSSLTKNVSAIWVFLIVAVDRNNVNCHYFKQCFATLRFKPASIQAVAKMEVKA